MRLHQLEQLRHHIGVRCRHLQTFATVVLHVVCNITAVSEVRSAAATPGGSKEMIACFSQHLRGESDSQKSILELLVGCSGSPPTWPPFVCAKVGQNGSKWVKTAQNTHLRRQCSRVSAVTVPRLGVMALILEGHRVAIGYYFAPPIVGHYFALSTILRRP
jgi:hypothetical protein